MSKLYSVGELLIDFQSVGTGSLKDTAQFVKNAGGAPAKRVRAGGKARSKRGIFNNGRQ